ncbi:hypothetical protein KUC3_24820 [Alteromonas sp. KC3]|nr:hypothetical protein KUC3_24820 [Alteromonas sp. KC3]BCO23590.1 hypothetical protein KUC14_24590 [Alteromonas sp. KC14]
MWALELVSAKAGTPINVNDNEAINANDAAPFLEIKRGFIIFKVFLVICN